MLISFITNQTARKVVKTVAFMDYLNEHARFKYVVMSERGGSRCL